MSREMHHIEIPKTIKRIIKVLNKFGLWDGEPTFRLTGPKVFHFIFIVLFSISTAAGSFMSIDREESIFMMVVFVIFLVHTYRLYHLIWKKIEISTLINELGTHSTNDNAEFIHVDDKIKNVMKFSEYFTMMCICSLLSITICPVIFKGKMIFNIAFPLDWKENEASFWITHLYIVLGCTYAIICFLFAIFVWYLLLNCSIKYEMLGNRLRNMGKILGEPNRKVSEISRQKFFEHDLIAAIRTHQKVYDTIDHLQSTFSNFFFLQILTSSISICGSVYTLAFSSHDNLLQDTVYCIILVYNTFEILVVLYLGNEIKVSSHRLSYCLFESNWIDQTSLCRKKIIIIGEYLKRPQELKTAKLYPLNLQTFTKIMNGAYSMFNILQSTNLGH